MDIFLLTLYLLTDSHTPILEMLLLTKFETIASSLLLVVFRICPYYISLIDLDMSYSFFDVPEFPGDITSKWKSSRKLHHTMVLEVSKTLGDVPVHNDED